MDNKSNTLSYQKISYFNSLVRPQIGVVVNVGFPYFFEDIQANDCVPVLSGIKQILLEFLLSYSCAFLSTHRNKLGFELLSNMRSPKQTNLECMVVPLMAEDDPILQWSTPRGKL